MIKFDKSNEAKERFFEEMIEITPGVISDFEEILEDMQQFPAKKSRELLAHQVDLLMIINKTLIKAAKNWFKN